MPVPPVFAISPKFNNRLAPADPVVELIANCGVDTIVAVIPDAVIPADTFNDPVTNNDPEIIAEPVNGKLDAFAT
jgi:hypothetical protein